MMNYSNDDLSKLQSFIEELQRSADNCRAVVVRKHHLGIRSSGSNTVHVYVYSPGEDQNDLTFFQKEMEIMITAVFKFMIKDFASLPHGDNHAGSYYQSRSGSLLINILHGKWTCA